MPIDIKRRSLCLFMVTVHVYMACSYQFDGHVLGLSYFNSRILQCKQFAIVALLLRDKRTKMVCTKIAQRKKRSATKEKKRRIRNNSCKIKKSLSFVVAIITYCRDISLIL